MDTFDEIHPNDGMFEGDLNHYFNVGKQAKEIIMSSILIHDPKFKILFLPCGHGRNLRHFVKLLNPSQIYASDIDPSAIDFMKDYFGVNALTSDRSFSNLRSMPKMNIIFVGSLVTHLKERDSIKFIKLISRKLKNNGLIVLSSHGEFVNSRLGSEFNYGLDLNSALTLKEQYLKNGYGFAPYPYDPNYGISTIRLDWYNKLARLVPSISLARKTEQLWDNHHDVIVLKKNGFIKTFFNLVKQNLKYILQS
jgi:SAM-dependent methyltransferase